MLKSTSNLGAISNIQSLHLHVRYVKATATILFLTGHSWIPKTSGKRIDHKPSNPVYNACVRQYKEMHDHCLNAETRH